MKHKIAVIFMIFSLLSSLLYAEDNTVIPYKAEEFPLWALDLRRWEIVTIGSFPLSFMLTALVYDVSLYASTGFDGTVSFGENRTQDDIRNLLLISGGISLAIGLTDFIIQKVKTSKIQKEKQELDEQRRNNGESSGLIQNESR